MIKKIPTKGVMATNCYIVFDENTKDAMVVDPGDLDETIIKYIKENELKVKYIYLTHCHFDHILGVEWLKSFTNAKVCCLDKEEDNLNNEEITLGKAIIQKPVALKADMVFSENDEIKIGNLSFKVIHTPGHTSGSSCLYGDGILISGDTLFKGTYGRCDLPTGNLSNIVNSIKNKLFKLKDSTVVYPGHGDETTIKQERESDEF